MVKKSPTVLVHRDHDELSFLSQPRNVLRFDFYDALCILSVDFKVHQLTYIGWFVRCYSFIEDSAECNYSNE